MKLIFFMCLPIWCLAQGNLDAMQTLIDAKRYSEAQTNLERFVKTHPNNLKAIEMLGDAYGHQENWDEAIDEYEKLVDADETNAGYHYKYGGAMGMKALRVSKLRALGLLGGIKSSLKRAAELDKTHLGARWALVELYIQLPGIVGGSQKTALEYAQSLENISLVNGYLAKGYVYEYSDEPKQAEFYYRKAMKESQSIPYFSANPKESKPHKKHTNNRIHYQIGKVAADYNMQSERGLKFINQYIEDYSAGDGVPLEWAYLRKAQLYKNLKNKEEALKWITKALEARSDFELAQTHKDEILKM